MRIRRVWLVLAVTAASGLMPNAAPLVAAPPPTPAANRPVAARVDGVPIYVASVERMVEEVAQGRKIEASARPRLVAHALAHLINRELVQAYLRGRKVAAGQQDIAVELAAVERRLAAQQLTLDDLLMKTGRSRDEFVRDLAWQLTWKAYIQRNVTDQTMARFFQSRKREFDGTELRVRQILLKSDGAKDKSGLVAKAQRIRDEIRSGKLTFADAARRYSAGASADQGGNIGFIRRRGSMGEPFAKAAFGLQRGEISEPVTTPIGVHLIQCTEVNPGAKAWTDVRNTLRPALIQFLFHWLADQQRPRARVEMTGATPHFDPHSGVLVDVR